MPRIKNVTVHKSEKQCEEDADKVIISFDLHCEISVPRDSLKDVNKESLLGLIQSQGIHVDAKKVKAWVSKKSAKKPKGSWRKIPISSGTGLP